MDAEYEKTNRTQRALAVSEHTNRLEAGKNGSCSSPSRSFAVRILMETEDLRFKLLSTETFF